MGQKMNQTDFTNIFLSVAEFQTSKKQTNKNNTHWYQLYAKLILLRVKSVWSSNHQNLHVCGDPHQMQNQSRCQICNHNASTFQKNMNYEIRVNRLHPDITTRTGEITAQSAQSRQLKPETIFLFSSRTQNTVPMGPFWFITRNRTQYSECMSLSFKTYPTVLHVSLTHASPAYGYCKALACMQHRYLGFFFFKFSVCTCSQGCWCVCPMFPPCSHQTVVRHHYQPPVKTQRILVTPQSAWSATVHRRPWLPEVPRWS